MICGVHSRPLMVGEKCGTVPSYWRSNACVCVTSITTQSVIAFRDRALKGFIPVSLWAHPLGPKYLMDPATWEWWLCKHMTDLKVDRLACLVRKLINLEWKMWMFKITLRWMSNHPFVLPFWGTGNWQLPHKRAVASQEVHSVYHFKQSTSREGKFVSYFWGRCRGSGWGPVACDLHDSWEPPAARQWPSCRSPHRPR